MSQEYQVNTRINTYTLRVPTRLGHLQLHTPSISITLPLFNTIAHSHKNNKLVLEAIYGVPSNLNG